MDDPCRQFKGRIMIPRSETKDQRIVYRNRSVDFYSDARSREVLYSDQKVLSAGGSQAPRQVATGIARLAAALGDFDLRHNSFLEHECISTTGREEV